MNHPLLMFFAALLGGCGAVLRMMVDGWINIHITPHYHWGFPLGTIIVNVTACFALGLLTGLGIAHIAPDPVRFLLGSGFLGGYSTFSTASVEGVRLLKAGHPGLFVVHTGGMLILSLAATWLGFVAV
ncbi:fluoride efflux transporter FluC [Bifidobacterium bombi]|uniref:Fluoride-specific ion channel FluC n=1 Tax=Bifidobacterium bombi DSM 19703 TaxID=1341695 RepID=A0A086BP59_9BIFI|nr:CrcB family protein [Bifidobacterium bombi]KFF30723.1 CrcB-like protein [Bifidobacterium bombi DSM 19703]